MAVKPCGDTSCRLLGLLRVLLLEALLLNCGDMNKCRQAASRETYRPADGLGVGVEAEEGSSSMSMGRCRSGSGWQNGRPGPAKAGESAEVVEINAYQVTERLDDAAFFVVDDEGFAARVMSAVTDLSFACARLP
jgi:hypothetical protein